MLLCSFGFFIWLSIYLDSAVGKKWTLRESTQCWWGGWLVGMLWLQHTVPKEWPKNCSEDTCLSEAGIKLTNWSLIKYWLDDDDLLHFFTHAGNALRLFFFSMRCASLKSVGVEESAISDDRMLHLAWVTWEGTAWGQALPLICSGTSKGK